MRVISVNIGAKKQLNFKGQIIETGIFKYPVNSPVFLDAEEVKTDTIVNRKYHGGVNQAVYAYATNHYEYWKKLYPDLEWQYGMFGENLTVSNLEETEIRVGNRYRLGKAIIEVTKPREPCVKLGLRFGTQNILKQFWNTTKSGIYFKVIKTGYVSVNDTLQLVHESKNTPTIAAVYKSKKANK